MNHDSTLLRRMLMAFLSKKLSCWEPYQDARQDSEARWDAFRSSHVDELNHDVLDLIDTYSLAHERKCDAALFLGLQLGLEMGGLCALWDEG